MTAFSSPLRAVISLQDTMSGELPHAPYPLALGQFVPASPMVLAGFRHSRPIPASLPPRKDTLMSLDTLKSRMPDYAKDLKLNLGSLVNETVLTDQQKYGCMLASAHAVGEPVTLRALAAEAQGKMTPEAIKAAKAASAIMGMNNVYYRATHLISNTTYTTVPAKLRMNVIGSPGIDKADFELFSLAVSAVNGCGMCLDAHEAELRKHGLTTDQIQAGLRIGAVVNAAARVMAAESALESESV
jgi:alkyl hydroperoxide reductase subunit D